MEIPRRLWRFCTGRAQDALAERFGLPNEEWMQDWQWEVSDPDRVDEFLLAYESGELSDERFTLMETIIESTQARTDTEIELSQWNDTLALLEENIELHIYTVCYWACLDCLGDEDDLENAFDAAPDMRAILNRYRERFGFPFPESADEDL